jgi:predicted  nucleic acid-binding Zn-ribbon protein
LAALGKTPPEQSDQRLDILGDVERQLNRLRKEHQSDKDMQRHLGEALEEVDRERKLTTLALQRAREAQRRGASDEDNDDDTPALLGTKLLEHLKAVRAKEGLSRPVAIGMLGAEVAVLLTRTASTPAQRALLKARLGGSAVKFLAGTCLFERNALTFVLDKSVAGLAKKLKIALRDQAGKVFAVRVRDAQSQSTEEDLDEDSSTDGTGAPSDARAMALLSARLSTVAPLLKAMTADAGPRADELQRINVELIALSKRGEAVQALRLLDQLEPQLKRLRDTAAPVQAPATTPPKPAVSPVPTNLAALKAEAARTYKEYLRISSEAASFEPIVSGLSRAESAVRRWADALKEGDSAAQTDRGALRALVGELQTHRGRLKAAQDHAALLDDLVKEIDATPEAKRGPLLARMDTLLANFPT